MNKKITVLLLIILSLFITSCQKKETLKDTSTQTYCEKALSDGQDLNLNGCMYEDLENGNNAVFYLPDGSLHMTSKLRDDKKQPEDYLPWVHVVPIKSFVTDENLNIGYYMSVLESLLFDNEEKIEYELNGSHLDFFITSDMVEKFAEERSLIKPEEPVDEYGIIQVLMQSIADTVYANFPEIEDVTCAALGMDKITPISDNYYIDPETLLPLFFGSENSYIGDISYSDYKKTLEDSGVKFDNYKESHHLFMINGFVYDSFGN